MVASLRRLRRYFAPICGCVWPSAIHPEPRSATSLSPFYRKAIGQIRRIAPHRRLISLNSFFSSLQYKKRGVSERGDAPVLCACRLGGRLCHSRFESVSAILTREPSWPQRTSDPDWGNELECSGLGRILRFDQRSANEHGEAYAAISQSHYSTR
jgi:hypothetical protein